MRKAYRRLLESRSVLPDAFQERAVEALSDLQGEVILHRTRWHEYLRSMKDREERIQERLMDRKKDGTYPSVDARPMKKEGTNWYERFRMRIGSCFEDGSFRGIDASKHEDEMDEKSTREAIEEELGPPPMEPKPPKGCYLYGGVGSGKTMIMDLFHHTLPDTIRKRRIHYNEAMLEIHALLHKHGNVPSKVSSDSREQALSRTKSSRSALMSIRRKRSNTHGKASLPLWKAKSSDQLRDASKELFFGDVSFQEPLGVLCFDEVQITDPFGLFALKGLFECLVEHGCVIVVTSNRTPSHVLDEHSKDDLESHLVQQIHRHMEPLMISQGIDYRKDHLLNGFDSDGKPSRVYFDSNVPSERIDFERKWKESIRTEAVPSVVQTSYGRALRVPLASGNVARFDFAEICGHPLGPADYVAICRSFHTIYVCDVPKLGYEQHDRARRFITLVDEAYNRRCLIVCIASVPPGEMFDEFEASPSRSHETYEGIQFETESEEQRSRMDVTMVADVSPVLVSERSLWSKKRSQLEGAEERNAFERAVSRLLEMQSSRYQRMHRDASSS